MKDREEELVSMFLEITACNNRDFASEILKYKGWNIQAAIQSFFEGDYAHEESVVLPSDFSSDSDSTNGLMSLGPEHEIEGYQGQELINLYSSVEPTGWGSEEEAEVDESQNEDSAEPWLGHRTMSELNSLGLVRGGSDWQEGSSETNLSILYRCPNHLMYHGNFHEAKVEASLCDKWLLVNVQSSEQFYSHLLNRDTWSNDTVQEILKSNFVFFQISHKATDGQKICCFYNLKSLPTILVIDPITGQKMYAWQGMKLPEDLLEDLIRFTDRSPKLYHNANPGKENANASTHQIEEASEPVIASPQSITNPTYPSLPEEATEKKLICKVGICLPSGQRVQRNFLKTDSTKLLWSFCSTLLEEGESKRFCFIAPSSAKLLYEKDTSFEEADLSNSLLRLCFLDDN